MGYEITVCMGSSCFARGNATNLELIEKYLREHPGGRVRLKGCHCMDECADGPSIKIARWQDPTTIRPADAVETIHRVPDGGTLLDLLRATLEAPTEV